MKLIDAARQFLQSKSAKSQAFLDREEALNTKVTELEAKKSKVIVEYDPTKGFDSKALDKLDAEIAAVKKEIAVLKQTKQLTPDYDVDESLNHIAKVKEEAQVFVAGKVKAEEEARQKIAEAKKALLQAQAAHFNIVRQANDFTAGINDTLKELSFGIEREIDKLRLKAQDLDREIFNLSSTTSFNVINGSQSQIDVLQAELGIIRAEISRLQASASTVSIGIPQLDNHRDGNGRTVYFAHANEQFDAANKGIAPN